MSTQGERIEVHRRIAASSSTIFGIVSDPEGHVAIDGSGMLVAAPDAKRLRAVGDTFDMHMDREPLGDIPLGKYVVRNMVTVFDPDLEIEWNVGAPNIPPLGHVYGFRLTPAKDGGTDVTHYCDWSQLVEAMRKHVKFPVVPGHMLDATLVNLERVATSE